MISYKSCVLCCAFLDSFDVNLSKCLSKWDELGRLKVKNYNNEFSNYFAEHKTEAFRNHMIKAIRDKVSYQGAYRQNSIEWAHYITKTEIDMGLKNHHKTAFLTEVIGKMKDRHLRMYRDVIKTSINDRCTLSLYKKTWTVSKC